MMYCPQCGKELKEGEVCGCANNAAQKPEYPTNANPASLQNPPYREPQPYEPPAYGQQYPRGNPYTAPATPVIDILRRHGSSSLMMALVILLGVGCLTSIVNLITSGGWANGYSAYTMGYNLGTTLVSTLMTVPNIVMFIGVLKLYLDCRSPKGPFVQSGGLTVIQVMAIISASLIGLIILICAIVLGIAGSFATAAMWEYTDDLPAGLAGMALSIVYVILFLAAAVMVLYYITFIYTVSALKNDALTGTPAKRVSMVFIVMLYILGGFLALGIFGIASEPISAVSSAVSAAAYIIGGIVLAGYRNEINALVRGF